MSMDVACLYSTVKNISGVLKNFTFLPPHGVELAINGQITVFGSILEAVNRGDRFGNRFMNALEVAIEAGQLEIRNTPAPIYLDEVGVGTPKMLRVQNQTVVVDDPCWQSLSAA